MKPLTLTKYPFCQAVFKKKENNVEKNIFNRLDYLQASDSIPSEWRKSFLMPLYMNKRNRLKYESYREIKFMYLNLENVGMGNRAQVDGCVRHLK